MLNGWIVPILSSQRVIMCKSQVFPDTGPQPFSKLDPSHFPNRIPRVRGVDPIGKPPVLGGGSQSVVLGSHFTNPWNPVSKNPGIQFKTNPGIQFLGYSGIQNPLRNGKPALWHGWKDERHQLTIPWLWLFLWEPVPLGRPQFPYYSRAWRSVFRIPSVPHSFPPSLWEIRSL